MSECDKAEIVGYIEQNPQQIKWINFLKEREIEIVNDLEEMMSEGFGFEGCPLIKADKRWLSIAKTHIQQGFMAAVRAVARPNGD